MFRVRPWGVRPFTVALTYLSCYGLLAFAQDSPTGEQPFPLKISIDSAQMIDFGASISREQQIQAANVGMELPGFAVFQGKINGENHWVFGCRKENVLRESLPCTTLPVGEYKGRWVHDHSLLQIVGGTPEAPIVRFLTVSDNPKNPPSDDNPLMHNAAYDFPVRFPEGKDATKYPVLVHVYGGFSYEMPIATLPARTSCTAHAWTPYQTTVKCIEYPPIEIHRGYVTLDISVGYVSYASLRCEAKWRWSNCSLLDPGLYYARATKNRFVLLTHDRNGNPDEVGFIAEAPKDRVQSPIK